MATTVAVIVAAGRGTRAAAGPGIPKQYAPLGGEPVLAHSLRVLAGHFSKEHHFGFEAVAWYWHFVDVVWLGLFLFVYVL